MKNKLFTVGPVEMYENTLEIRSKQIPYFRTNEFSLIIKECEKMFLTLLNAPIGSKLAILTSSGTGAMEASIMNALNSYDKVLIIDGGNFGHRFSMLCDLHNIAHHNITLKFGEELTKEKLNQYTNKNYTALLVNAHETSTGQLYNLKMLGEFCKKNNMKFIVDAVSSFLVDQIDMRNFGIDLIITASQKALALAPGLSFIIVNEEMFEIIQQNNCKCKYFDLMDYFNDMDRGQTPYTPAVGIVYELHSRLTTICSLGINEIIQQHYKKAHYFRKKCKEIGLIYGDYPLSNGLTPLIFDNSKAYEYFIDAKKKYGLVMTPTGGELKDKVLRVGHMGNLNIKDYDRIIEYFKEVI